MPHALARKFDGFGSAKGILLRICFRRMDSSGFDRGPVNVSKLEAHIQEQWRWKTIKNTQIHVVMTAALRAAAL